jgi:hypothetical protein
VTYRAFCFRILLVAMLAFTLVACSNMDNDDTDEDDDDEEVTIIDNPIPPVVISSTIQLTELGRFRTNIFNENAAASVAYDPVSQRLFVVNDNQTAPTVDVLNVRDPTEPTRAGTLDIRAQERANSVAIHSNVVAVAIENTNRQSNGVVAFYNTTNFNRVRTVTVGARPKMLTFTPDGSRLLVANEGEPNDTYTIDPEGSVSIIDMSGGITDATATTATFTAFNDDRARLISQGVRIFGPSRDEPDRLATVAQDLEPEYIAVASNSQTAWVTLQENNALAIINIADATVRELVPLGFKNHAIPGNGFDASDMDAGINLRRWPVFGMYQPEAIATYVFNGITYLVTANAGASREFAGFNEVARVADLTLDPAAFPNADDLQEEENLGRLEVTRTLGDGDNNGEFTQLFAFGARSFAIWKSQGQQVFEVFDSTDFEVRTANRLGARFNSANTFNDGDSRSPVRGPEPTILVLGVIENHTYAFIGLNQVGGIMVYDISQPENPRFIQYLNNRNFNRNPATGRAGDLGPAGMVFIPASQSPNGRPLLAVTYEVSGTTTLYQINVVRLTEP